MKSITAVGQDTAILSGKDQLEKIILDTIAENVMIIMEVGIEEIMGKEVLSDDRKWYLVELPGLKLNGLEVKCEQNATFT